VSDPSPATTLVLVRHAQARSRSDPRLGRATRLSPLGQRQVAALAERLAQEGPFAALYASPLPRAAQTAALLCERLGLTPCFDPRLVEFELGARPVEAIRERPDLRIWLPHHVGADGETLHDFSARVAAFCEETVVHHAGARVAVVCHAGTIDAALRWALGLPPASPWQHEFELLNASITEVEFWPRGRVPGGAPRYAALRRVGDAAHLGGETTDL
jgi:broad specificity phosphatase PhoE